MTPEIGLLLALVCAFVANLGFFYKHRGANAVAKVSVRHPLRSAFALYSSRWFALGMAIATASWGLHVTALALTPWLAVAVCASVIAFYASARGLQDSDAVPVIAVTGTAANIAGIAGGIVVFGDPMAGGVLGVTLQALAFVLVVVASALMPAPLRAARVAASA